MMNMKISLTPPQWIGLSLFLVAIFSSMLGGKQFAHVAVLAVFPVVMALMYFDLERARKSNQVPAYLRFIATLRGDRRALRWGYIILGLIALGWLLEVFVLIARR
ncbi:MAG: hypothetical protein ACOY9J_04575 [Pseudomonadota bacterium]